MTRPSKLRVHRIPSCLLITLLAACGGGGGENSLNDGSTSNRTSANSPPIVLALPQLSVRQGETFSYTPNASDPDGDPLAFSVTGLPAWINFDPTTGSLTGFPTAADVGSYQGITVSVNDGTTTTTIGPFSVTVTQVGSGSVSLSWIPPLSNADGSTLDDLAGYRVYYGLSLNNYPNTVLVSNPGITNYVVENLSPNNYFFVVTALDIHGNESDLSDVATSTVL